MEDRGIGALLNEVTFVGLLFVIIFNGLTEKLANFSSYEREFF